LRKCSRLYVPKDLIIIYKGWKRILINAKFRGIKPSIERYLLRSVP